MCQKGDVVLLRVLDHKGEWTYEWIDRCMAHLVQAMNDHGIRLSGCCCGHGKDPGYLVILTEGISVHTRVDKLSSVKIMLEVGKDVHTA